MALFRNKETNAYAVFDKNGSNRRINGLARLAIFGVNKPYGTRVVGGNQT